ncbi:uncharacterized protein LOC111704853 isoform X2 [Eurytemora carolleeae]|uniref:uncharacterized protein LOC111704853 isoform X2 n=1 Tax=Eurytemora carolleeae TaxID=1294199 RepID=UPI000C778B3D|nr:uncharacterized protein LOC111704853 isoform X2 [Eurytemora carolleeae]|eukprot:XP_023332984.1 uncharacterized protein LOC111704853 isoform X2 [Eurytemora affinis]
MKIHLYTTLLCFLTLITCQKLTGKQVKMKGKQTDPDTLCITNLVTAEFTLNNKVRFFDQQISRIQSQIFIMEKKQEKKNGFFIVAEMLDAITSTSISPSCSNSQNRDVTVDLSECSGRIVAACPVLSINETLTGVCMDLVLGYKAKVAECEKLVDLNLICDCWADTVELRKGLDGCSAFEESQRILKQFNQCKSEFSACKKAQDAASKIAGSCPVANLDKPVIFPSPSPSPSSSSSSTQFTTVAPSTSNKLQKFHRLRLRYYKNIFNI